jgi:parallel beta-helix repeat protein
MVIQNNVTSNSIKEHGIYVSNSAISPTVINNVVFGNRGCGIHMNGDARQEGQGVVSNALIEGNIIYNNGVSGGSAINLDGVIDSVIRNNLLFNNHHSGISLFQGDAALPSTNDLVINNTIIMAADSKSGAALNVQGGSTGTHAFNNVFLTTNPKNPVALNIAATAMDGFVSDNNVLTPYVSADNGQHNLTMAKWQTLTGNDLHSKTATAATLGFTDLALNDFHLNAPALAGIGSQLLPRGPAMNYLPPKAPLLILDADGVLFDINQ